MSKHIASVRHKHSLPHAGSARIPRVNGHKAGMLVRIPWRVAMLLLILLVGLLGDCSAVRITTIISVSLKTRQAANAYEAIAGRQGSLLRGAGTRQSAPHPGTQQIVPTASHDRDLGGPLSAVPCKRISAQHAHRLPSADVLMELRRLDPDLRPALSRLYPLSRPVAGASPSAAQKYSACATSSSPCHSGCSTGGHKHFVMRMLLHQRCLLGNECVA